MAAPADRAAAFTTGSIPPLGFVLMVNVALAWGLNWPAMKIAVVEFQPFTFRVLSIAVAASALLLVTRLRGEPAGLPLRRLPEIALIGVVAVTGWQMFSAFGLLYVGGGKAAIIAFTMPLWATLLSVWFLGERLGWHHAWALLLGAGALALLLGEDLALVGQSPIGGLLMTAAAVCWATGTILVKKIDFRMPVMAFTAWQMLLGAVPMLFGWWLVEPLPDFGRISTAGWTAFLFTSLIGTVVGMTSYYRLVRLVPASVAATATLTVPVVGVISSAILLGETVGLAQVAALVLVVAALLIMVRGGQSRRIRRAAAPPPGGSASARSGEGG